jgi:Sec-independent protein translocase protein TatA
LADYWWIPLLVVGAILVVVFFPKKKGMSALQKIANELGAIDAKREAREVKLQLGAEQAKQHVTEKYAERRKQLDDQAEAKAKELEDDPVALAQYLERLTRG